jgi:pSer/pThr/pTyr-binding forkhead associated (FHA) protein
VARFVDLVAIEGPDKGMRYTVEEGTYRVLARAPDERQSTLQMTPDGDRALDREQEQLVDDVFKGRQSGGTRTAAKKRGPDIVLRDGSVSRTHAMVFVDKKAASVVDLMSTNGTKVNGTVVKDVDIAAGDVIHLGKTKLRVEDG